MNPQIAKLLFWVGILAYLVSFFLPLVGGPGVFTPKPPTGADCALEWFLFPWVCIHLYGVGALLADVSLGIVSITLSGWINPLFWVAVPFMAFRGTHRISKVLRLSIVLMMPFCWVVFLDRHVYPREGYVLWMTGMLLVLFSNRTQIHGLALPPPGVS